MKSDRNSIEVIDQSYIGNLEYQQTPSARNDNTDIPTISAYHNISQVEEGFNNAQTKNQCVETKSIAEGNDEENGEDSQEKATEFDKGYAWVVLAAATTISCFSWGSNSAFGVFLSNFMTTNRYPGATDMEFAFVGGLSFGIGLLASPISTLLIKRFPYQVVTIFGAFVQASGLILASLATRTWHLYLSQGVLQGLGISLVFIPANAAIPQWFKVRRGVANGIFTAGSGVGGLMFSFVVQALINKFGIPWAQRISGFMCLVACLLGGCCIKSRHHNKQSHVSGRVHAPAKFYDKELLRRVELYLVVVWGTLTMLGYVIVLYSMSAYSVSIGLTHSQGAAVSACVSAGIIVGRASMGALIDRYGSMNISLLSSLLTAILIFAMWINAKTYPVLLATGIMLGLFLSSSSTGFPPMCASIVELKLLVPMYSMSWIIIGGCGIFAEPLAILLRINHMYIYTQVFTGCLFLVGTLFLLNARAIQVRKVLREGRQEKHQESSDSGTQLNDNDSKRINDNMETKPTEEKQTTIPEIYEPNNASHLRFFHCMIYMIKI